MTLIEFIGTYKGEIPLTVTAVVDGESKIIARIDRDERVTAINDNILNSEVLDYSITLTDKVPLMASSIDVTLKEIAADTTENAGNTDSGDMTEQS